MASMFMVAIEATIVSTAMPHIVAELGGLAYYAWVFSAFLLAQTATTVISGKLADMFGRKPVMQAGIGIFVVGTLLGGCAWSMPSLVAFRVIQGIGAGVVQPVAMTIVADLYPATERGKIQGFLSSVWAFSAVVGPLVGGVIVDDLSWRWVFWLNVPVGIVAAAIYARHLHETVEHRERAIDVLGSLLFVAVVGALMFALGDIGTASMSRIALALAVLVAAALAFYAQERRATDPIVSFAMWARRPILTANGVSGLASIALMGLTTFLPMYVQVVLGGSPVVAGLALTMMLLGWPVGAALSTRFFPRFGVRNVLFAGSLFLPLGAVLFVALTPQSSVWQAGLGSALMGFGMGLVNVSAMVLIQEVVAWSERGAVTASSVFARNLGSTLGATLFGAVVNAGLARAPGDAAEHADALKHLLAHPENAKVLDNELLTALAAAIHTMFVAMGVLTLLLVAVAACVPHVALARKTERPSLAD
ncbi:MAG: MFS transporter [Proteobacteria bacterium]|nr:MFS transporter [Pseudomonadota bacterium]